MRTRDLILRSEELKEKKHKRMKGIFLALWSTILGCLTMLFVISAFKVLINIIPYYNSYDTHKVTFTIKDTHKEAGTDGHGEPYTKYSFDLVDNRKLTYTEDVSEETYKRFKVGSRVTFMESEQDMYRMNENYPVKVPFERIIATFFGALVFAILLMFGLSDADSEGKYNQSLALWLMLNLGVCAVIGFLCFVIPIIWGLGKFIVGW